MMSPKGKANCFQHLWRFRWRWGKEITMKPRKAQNLEPLTVCLYDCGRCVKLWTNWNHQFVKKIMHAYIRGSIASLIVLAWSYFPLWTIFWHSFKNWTVFHTQGLNNHWRKGTCQNECFIGSKWELFRSPEVVSKFRQKSTFQKQL